ncbi:glutamate mutase L, partial [candidate division WOR-3 bacterium]|nr:glutamate mutase L [candidate division WOR-3 bacterium]
VMAHAPGYKKLMKWTDVPIMPTPGAVGLLIEKVARKENIEVLGVDIGGATTDIFSVFQGVFNRTVSANLGMSYSISNVLAETGIQNIMRWVPFEIDERDLRNRIRNKMIRPTTIPQSLKELMIEQAIAREALRLALIQHKRMAVGLKGVQQERTISDAFAQTATGASLVNMMTLNLVIGSGGILSHAPRRVQAALMMMDAFEIQGITKLAVDSIFMMPHLGVLSTVHEKSATEVFDKDCLIRLGTSIVPVGQGREGEPAISVRIEGNEYNLKYGDIKLIPIEQGKKVKAEIVPSKRFDVGKGRGKMIETELEGGVVGTIIDARGRPLVLPEDPKKRREHLDKWFSELNLYPSN